MDIESSKSKWLAILKQQQDSIELIKNHLKNDDFEQAIIENAEMYKRHDHIEEIIGNIREILSVELQDKMQELLGSSFEIRYSQSQIGVFYDDEIMGVLNIESRVYSHYDFCIHEDAFEIGDRTIAEQINEYNEKYDGNSTVSAFKFVAASRQSGKFPSLRKLRNLREEMEHEREQTERHLDTLEQTFVKERQMTIVRINELLHEKYKIIQFFKEYGFINEPSKHTRKIYVHCVDKYA